MITIRASAISDFLDCPARAEAKHLLGLRTPSSSKAQIGTAIHAATAVFDQSRLDNNPVTADEAAGAAVDVIRNPRDDVEWDEASADDAERIAIALHKRYCSEVAPTREYAAVEVSCERLEISDLGIALQGTTDRVRRVGDGFGISDLKSGKTAVSASGEVATKGHAFQLGVYEILAERAAGVPITEPAEIVGFQTGKTEKGQRVAVGAVYGARDALLGDEQQHGVLQAVAHMVTSGVFYGNPRSQLCGEKFCPIYNRCHYRR